MQKFCKFAHLKPTFSILHFHFYKTLTLVCPLYTSIQIKYSIRASSMPKAPHPTQKQNGSPVAYWIPILPSTHHNLHRPMHPRPLSLRCSESPQRIRESSSFILEGIRRDRSFCDRKSRNQRFAKLLMLLIGWGSYSLMEVEIWRISYSLSLFGRLTVCFVARFRFGFRFIFMWMIGGLRWDWWTDWWTKVRSVRLINEIDGLRER